MINCNYSAEDKEKISSRVASSFIENQRTYLEYLNETARILPTTTDANTIKYRYETSVTNWEKALENHKRLECNRMLDLNDYTEKGIIRQIIKSYVQVLAMILEKQPSLLPEHCSQYLRVRILHSKNSTSKRETSAKSS